MHIQGNVSVHTTAHLVSSFGRDLEDRPVDICSNNTLNHAILQLFVLFWHQRIGIQLHLSSVYQDLTQVWESEEGFNRYLLHETRDNGPDDRGFFVIAFNLRAFQHSPCESFEFCKWSISQVWFLLPYSFYPHALFFISSQPIDSTPRVRRMETSVAQFFATGSTDEPGIQKPRNPIVTSTQRAVLQAYRMHP